MNGFWYYAEGNETRGPIAFDQLLELLSHLPTPRGVLVWRDGFDDWTAAESVREIAEKLIRPPPLRLGASVSTRSAGSATADTVAALNEVLADNAVPPSGKAMDTVARYQQQFQKEKGHEDGLDTVDRYQQQFRKVRAEFAPQSELTGLGGWLALLGFGLVVSTFRFLLQIGGALSSQDPKILAKYPSAMIPLLVIDVALLVFFIVVTTLFFNKSHNFPRAFIWLLVTSILEPLVGVAWLALTMPAIFNVASLFEPKDVGQMIVAVIGAALWIPYVLKSKRVENTFVY
jgi:hypothetical protein